MAYRNKYLDQARMGLQGVGGGIMGGFGADPRMQAQMQQAQMFQRQPAVMPSGPDPRMQAQQAFAQQAAQQAQQAFQAQEAAQMHMTPISQIHGPPPGSAQRMTPEARQQHHVMRPGEMPGLG